MREIKFRAWNKDQKIMCYDDEDRTEDYMDGILSTRIGLINSWLSTPEYEFDYRSLYEVMQYTGLKDRNGKEIYEGDVVDSWAGLDTHEMYIREVVKKEDEPRIDFKPSTGFTLCKNNEHLFEVIGNIYENPELLEAE